MKSWLAQGSSGRRVTLLPGTTFLHINGALRLGLNTKIRQGIGRTIHCNEFTCRESSVIFVLFGIASDCRLVWLCIKSWIINIQGSHRT